MCVPVKYTVPLKLLRCEKGHLERLRQHLVSIGYPLASNEELNAPDSVIRLQSSYHLVATKDVEHHRVYYVARTE
ncbi:hypothetical protein CHOED_019 [Vibrio phage CHOED]|uniref:hypothetical protein n=1 Tax=Vibrio phage CHOED TaxID=1458716 RepID=UPI00042E2C35|nr:hypothetical protein CHOED_019 [Vibrio phage CHOED]AHK11879.1 hypothetical protein CHOED_019 [Vibrio phage CHOED]